MKVSMEFDIVYVSKINSFSPKTPQKELLKNHVLFIASCSASVFFESVYLPPNKATTNLLMPKILKFGVKGWLAAFTSGWRLPIINQASARFHVHLSLFIVVHLGRLLDSSTGSLTGKPWSCQYLDLYSYHLLAECFRKMFLGDKYATLQFNG